ncbi:hypothetical protein [Solibaculum mannosilyticum]|uniref:Zn-finger containing protein n=1 Tax=Solibaculum mannosilyticum TaxID=2780922 RepID=A0A7I8D1Y5_9FIRM|nr:hypothetical protein [Solibaculum mannosilyticum]BCI60766.1 hypothetical protein C12CBH8_14050 [Solibaculum mannosilyticum]CZT57535.1 hypothetical protein BN3661_02054 [Eubacteriaceae bacterium CHKCI005]
MNWLRNFMSGRYGLDQLSLALVILTMVLTLISSIFRWPILVILSYIPLLLCVLRSLSRKTDKRYRENQRFLKIWNPIKSKFSLWFSRREDRKTHKYFKCPHCSNTLRVPKGRGKISITCPVCKTQFIRKS